MDLKIEYLSPDDIKPYEKNAKQHPAEQVEQIKQSIREYGFNDPVAIWKDNVVIEGHGRLIAALEMGMESIPVIRLDELTDQQRKAYALVHNKLTMNSGFDPDMLQMELDDIFDYDMSDFGFDLVTEEGNGLTENPYTTLTQVPQYEVTGEDVGVHDLLDTRKSDELIAEIESSGVSEYEKAFLKLAANRHIVFNFREIAEYYAVASAEMQRLMERSALVLIDYNNAIANGYVELHKALERARNAG